MAYLHSRLRSLVGEDVVLQFVAGGSRERRYVELDGQSSSISAGSDLDCVRGRGGVDERGLGAGAVTMNDLYAAVPYDDSVVSFGHLVSGSELLDMTNGTTSEFDAGWASPSTNGRRATTATTQQRRARSSFLMGLSGRTAKKEYALFTVEGSEAAVKDAMEGAGVAGLNYLTMHAATVGDKGWEELSSTRACGSSMSGESGRTTATAARALRAVRARARR